MLTIPHWSGKSSHQVACKLKQHHQVTRRTPVNRSLIVDEIVNWQILQNPSHSKKKTRTYEQCFLVVRGLNPTCTPTRRPTQAYAACEGCLREHKSASRCLRGCLRGQMLSSSVEVHCGSSSCKIATFQYKCSFGSSGSKIRGAVHVRIQHLSKNLAARKGLSTQNALKACANAYAGPTRSLREDCRTNRRKAKVQQTPTRKAYARGDTTAYALKPTRAYAPNQDCLRKVHAVPFLCKPFQLIQNRCSYATWPPGGCLQPRALVSQPFLFATCPPPT